jgi:hypothetical protein
MNGHVSRLRQFYICGAVVAEWLGCRTQPEGYGFESWRRYRAAWYREQDTLKSTARGSHDKQNCLRHSPLTSTFLGQFLCPALGDSCELTLQ